MGVFMSFVMFFNFFLKMSEEPKLILDESCDLDVENEEVLTLQETLEALSLSEYVSTFEKEKIDMESLVLMIDLFLFKIVFLVYKSKIENDFNTLTS